METFQGLPAPKKMSDQGWVAIKPASPHRCGASSWM